MPDQRIIILGGGFAGVQCARTLQKLLPGADYKIVLFNKENHMVFSPLLAEVASAAIKAKDVAAPLRQLLSGVKCRTEEVLSVNLDESFIEYEGFDLTRRRMDYDHLVIACGNTTNFATVPGMNEHAIPLKSVGDALYLQSHVIEQMEKAEVCDDPDMKKKHLSFTVVGGGFSGVEIAGELNEFVKESSRYYESINKNEVTVNLIHGHSQILPEVSPSLREFARKKMEARGVNFYLGQKATRATAEGVFLTDNTCVCGETVVCTIGTTPLPLVDRLAVKKDRGRIMTEADMSIPGFANAWAIGDCAAVPNAAAGGELSPPVGQFAERQGKQLAENIAAKLKGAGTKPFSHTSLGHLCAIGGLNAVAEIGGIHISGFPAWFLWRTIYLMKLPAFSQKIKVGIEWACDLIFPRDLGYVKVDRTKSISRAFYSAGDYVFREGSPATDFFVIQQGKVDILVWNEKKQSDELVAVLGKGDFFGEAALIADRPRNASVRAREDLMVVKIGSNLFTEMSSHLTPLKDALVQAGRRRTNVWQHIPEVQDLLMNMPLSKIIEPVPGNILAADDLIVGILEQFQNRNLDFCCVLNGDKKLEGVVTRSDLIRTIEMASALSEKEDEIIRVGHIMHHEPISITKTESTEAAVLTMREHGLKTLPVVDNKQNNRLVGCIRIETILCHLVRELTDKQAIRITEMDMANPLYKRG